MVSSLQRASQAKNNNVTATAKKGDFESCFATGLDLSELTTSAPGGSRTSASAELLRIKKQDLEHAAREEQEEIRIQQLVKEKTDGLEESMHQRTLQLEGSPKVQRPSKTESTTSGRDLIMSTNVFSTLVTMHKDDDHCDTSKASRSRKKRRGGAKFSGATPPSCKTAKAKAVKKKSKRRAKY